MPAAPNTELSWKPRDEGGESPTAQPLYGSVEEYLADRFKSEDMDDQSEKRIRDILSFCGASPRRPSTSDSPDLTDSDSEPSDSHYGYGDYRGDYYHDDALWSGTNKNRDVSTGRMCLYTKVSLILMSP